MKTIIAVIGKYEQLPHDPAPAQSKAVAEEVGREIAEHGAVLLSGGLTGVMEAASKGAKEAGGLVIGMIPGFHKEDANPYCDIVLTTGLASIRNVIVVRSSDAVIMVGGASGTLNELTIAYGSKPVVVVEGSGGWTDRIRDVLYEGKYLDERRLDEIHFAHSAHEAVELALHMAATRPRRPTFDSSFTDPFVAEAERR